MTACPIWGVLGQKYCVSGEAVTACPIWGVLGQKYCVSSETDSMSYVRCPWTEILCEW